MKRTDIINHFIEKRKYKRYLEIGVDHGENFKKVVCEEKFGVDPAENSNVTHQMTSDDFFKKNKKKFDIVFIDGLHHAEQVEKDIENSLKFLKKGGVIVLHDCIPHCERIQRVPRETKEWTGDVWKAIIKVRRQPDIHISIVDTDYGVGIIEKGQQTPLIIDNPTFAQFEAKKNEWLNIISPEEFLNKY